MLQQLNQLGRRGWTTLLALAVTCFCGLAQANVSLKNGNFFVAYTDIVYPGGFEPKLERVYNSKSPYLGMFGWGWGNEYEVYLNVSADGSVVVHEYGGGAENRFSPAAFNSVELQRAVDMIADAARKTGALGSASQLEAYRTKLKSDSVFRNDEWEKLRSEGKLQARNIAPNTKLYSNRFSYQFITRTTDGYYRAFESGRLEKFDHSGHLVKITDKNNNFIQLSYNREGRLTKILDNFNRKIFLTLDENGRVSKVQGENGKEASYRYNDLGELIFSKDVDGNSYSYKYSSDRRHNLVQIDYSDKTRLEVVYYGRDKHENVRTVKDRDGTQSEYSYETNAREPGYSMVAVQVKDSEGKVIASSKYEYYTKHKSDGEEWNYKLVTTLDGDRTETMYNECCGLPLLIKKGNEETAFEYNQKGNVTKKITPTEITQLTYDPKAGKVARVEKFSKTDKRRMSWSAFRYDDKANLIFAENSDRRGVTLFYDTNGRIKSLVDQSKRRIDFKYNENSKPIQITDPALGSITVSYTNSGEIKKVDSTAGRKIAMQVTSAFQNLLDIIRPAGVSLAF